MKIHLSTVKKLGEFLLEEMTTYNTYARRVNKEIVDVTIDLSDKMIDLILKYDFKCHGNVNDILDAMNSEGLIYTKYNLKPIDAIELFNKKSAKEYGYGKFLEKYSDEHVKGTIPVYIQFKHEKDKNPTEFDLAAYITRSENKDYMYTNISDSKIVIEFYDLFTKDIVMKLLSKTTDKQDTMGLYSYVKQDIIRLVSHEFQHALDDYIIYKKSTLTTKYKNEMYNGFQQNANRFNITQTEANLIYSTLYLLSDSEVKANIQSISSMCTYCMRNPELKQEFNDIINKLHSIYWESYVESSRKGHMGQMYSKNMFDAIRCMSSSVIFGEQNVMQSLAVLSNIINTMRRNDHRSFVRIMTVVGYFFMLGKKLKLSIDKSLTKDDITNYLSDEHIEDILNDEVNIDSCMFMCEFIANNVFYYMYDYVIQVYKIFAEHVNEMFNIIYSKPLDADYILNENDTASICRGKYIYFM